MFDKSLYQGAVELGANFKMHTKFIDYNFKNKRISTSKGDYESKILIGADGPNSSVAKKTGIEVPKDILFAAQVRLKSKLNSDTAELWFDVVPEFFAWVVPENDNIARVGLMNNKNPMTYLEKFIKRRFGRPVIFDRTGDSIRYGLIKKSVKNNVLVVGDAACQIKPFSAGGLIYGQIGANHAARACIKALEKNDFSEKFFVKNYDREWKKELSKPIKQGVMFKRLFSKFGDKPLFFKMIRELKITSLSSFLDMDFLGKD